MQSGDFFDQYGLAIVFILISILGILVLILSSEIKKLTKELFEFKQKTNTDIRSINYRFTEFYHWVRDDSIKVYIEHPYWEGKNWATPSSLVSYLEACRFVRQEEIDFDGIHVNGDSYTKKDYTVCEYCARKFGDSDRCQHCGAPSVFDYRLYGGRND